MNITKVQGTEAPVLQLTNKILRADALCQVELALPVQTQNVLEDPRRSVEVEFPTDETKGVTEGENLS